MVPATGGSSPFNESVVEEAAIDWFSDLGYAAAAGPEIAPDGNAPERESYASVVLVERLRTALARLNPGLPGAALDDALRRLTHPEGATLEARNRAFHQMLVNGVDVEYRMPEGRIAGAPVRILDFAAPDRNDWLVVSQFTVMEGKRSRRPDVVVFLNGLPLAILELKNAADEGATIWTAFRQIQTYKAELPALFAFNELLVVSDGSDARLGTLTAGREWFKPWRTTTGEETAADGLPQLQVLIEGVFRKDHLLDLIRSFIVFEDEGGGKLVKKIAGYHQFHAVRTAVRETLRASTPRERPALAAEGGGGHAGDLTGGEGGDRRVGVVWHTQGSGKSLTMVFYAGRVIGEPAMRNPTLVVLTDRNDLDEQLFGTFSRCSDLLRQTPVKAASRDDLREKLRVAAGGVVFTTIQKFLPAPRERHPLLSDRRNIVVIADEAHRSQYDFVDGFARHMRDALPNASFIGFTGTPIELTDKNTRAVFGDYISVYDVHRAVEDRATVPIYYESRLAKLELDPSARPRIDPDFEEATEGEEVERRERLKTKWAQLEALVGSENRIRQVARDVVEHFERRLDAMDGKAMVVCMSRRICVELHREIAVLRPEWVADGDEEGALKIVMTGSASDPMDWQPHIRSKSRREGLANRFRDPNDPLRMVIVRDMWLTGFDAPPLHTMYLDKPMRAHGLMQAIARVNRVFRDKPGGLVVDYLGLAHELKQALAIYSASGGKGQAAVGQEEAVAAMTLHYEVCRGLMAGFDWSRWVEGGAGERVALLPAAQEHVLAQKKGKERFLEAVRLLSQAFALAVPHEAALAIRDDMHFFQSVRGGLLKRAPGEDAPEQDLDHAVRQIVSRAVVADGVLDVFAAAGLEKPDVSILSDEFLAEVRDMPRRNLAVELLRKLLSGEIRTRGRRNLVQARSFAAMLEQSIRRYQNRAVDAAQVIEELLELAREMREADRRGEELGLTEDEVAFYDALETNDSAVEVLGDETLRGIARELVAMVRANVTIDWTIRENVRARLRVIVKRILRKHGYPPDKQEKATLTVLQQAELLSGGWAAAGSWE